MMMDRMCNWFETNAGGCFVGALATIGGLHLIMTPPQKVLGFLPEFKTTVMGREVGAQQLVGLGLTLSGVCVLRNCMM